MSEELDPQASDVLRFCNEVVNWDADHDWRHLQGLPFEEQVERLSSLCHWISALHLTNLTWDEQERFWRSFTTDDAGHNRSIAVYGTKSVNHRDELDLIDQAYVEFQKWEAERAGELLQQHDKPNMKALGEAFARLVGKCMNSGDEKPFLRMATIIKQQGLEVPHPEQTESGKVWRAFCRLHLDSRDLPTKKQLRIAVDWGNEPEELEKLRRQLKKLGLSGLPEER